MKRFLFPLLAIFVVTACQKEVTSGVVTPNTGGNTTLTGSMTAKIDGVAWVADKGAGASFSPPLGMMPGLINITGISNGKKHITITLTDSGVHNYQLSPDNLWMNAASYIDSTQTNSFSYSTNQSYIPNEPNGSVKITKIDTVNKVMSGTFSFKVYRDMDSSLHTITDGVFTNIPFTNGFGLTPSNSTDTFRAKIDGASLAVYSINANLLSLTNQIMVQGATQSLSEDIGIILPSTTTPGSYPLDFFTITHLASYLKNGVSYASTSGTLKIVEHNTTTKRLRGNFSFVAQPLTSPFPSFQITEGYFSVIYQ